MDLKKMNLQELSSKEMKEIDGGWLIFALVGVIVGVAVALLTTHKE